MISLHHVQVSCPAGGEDAARRFYRDALGIEEVAKPPVLAARGGCWFRWDEDFPGYRRLYTHDGNGNRVEVLQPR